MLKQVTGNCPPKWSKRRRWHRDLHAHVRQMIEDAGRASWPRSPKEWTASEIETGRKEACLWWQISHRVTAHCGTKGSAAHSAPGCPGPGVSLDLKCLSLGTSTSGSGQTGRNSVNRGGSTGCTSTETLKSHPWGLRPLPRVWYNGTVWILSCSEENQNNRNTVK